MMIDWVWKVGLLDGFGEVMWQENEKKIRRITRFLPAPQGGFMILKSFLTVADADDEPEYDKGDLVVISRTPSEEFVEHATRAWEGGRVIPFNGRIKS